MKIVHSSRKRGWWLVVSALVLMAGAAGIVRKRIGLHDAPVYRVAPLPVQVAVCEVRDMERTVPYLAVIEPDLAATVAARHAAAVASVDVDEGDRVRAGQMLVRLDDRSLRHQVEEVNARIAEAEAGRSAAEAFSTSMQGTAVYWAREAERDRSLREQDLIPPAQAEATLEKANDSAARMAQAREQVASAVARIEALQAAREALEVQRGDAVIVSPFDGVVTRRLVDPGDYAQPGTPLIQVERQRPWRLAFGAPQADLARLATGLPVRVKGVEGGADWVIARIRPSLDASRLARVEAESPAMTNDSFVSGQYVSIDVVTGTRTGAHVIPRSAVIPSPEGEDHVFVVQGDRLEIRPITPLDTVGDDVAVSGIASGETVVIHTYLGWSRLSEGRPVLVRR